MKEHKTKTSFGYSILDVEKISEQSFQGQPYDLGWKRLYGGHLVAQALYSIHQSLLPKGFLHSFHSYFLHVGNTRHPLQYNIQPLRLGRQSSSIQVQTVQNKRHVFQMMASYSKDHHSYIHAPSKPTVPHPENLSDDTQMLKDLMRAFPHSQGLKHFATRRIKTNTGLDIRPIVPKNFLNNTEKTNIRRLWFRMRTNLAQELNAYLLAYASDFLLVGLSLQQHNTSILSPHVKFVSLDHAMWFHHPIPTSSWLLLDAKSIAMSNGRCLVQGYIYTASGRLVATCMQEGFIHMRNRVPS